MTREKKCDCDVCFYCGCMLSVRHEHDHFPIPANAGGDKTVSACVNCHDLKDRVGIMNWPVNLFMESMEALNVTGARLLMAKLLSLAMHQAVLDAKR